MKNILLLLVISLIICVCNNKSNMSLNDILKTNNYIIIDVRTEEEYKETHISGAINIPYNEINSNSNLDKDKTILVYCRSGNRSKVAYNTLTSLGYTVYDLGSFFEIDLPKE